MYCFTYASSYDCVFNELILWTDISSEHPVFITTVASLSGKSLPEDISRRLMDFRKDFKELNEKVKQTREILAYNSYYRSDVGEEVKKQISEFLIVDENFIELLGKVKMFSQEDKVWQTLLEHITEEQTFMKKLFTDLGMQL